MGMEAERGWIALKNTLFLLMHLEDEVKLAEIIAEFSSMVNMPKMLETVHKELDAITDKPHYKSIDLKSSTVGRFAARKEVKLKNPEVGKMNPRKTPAEDSHNKPRLESKAKFFPRVVAKNNRNQPDSRGYKRERSPEGDRRNDRDDERFDDNRSRRGGYKG